MHPDLPATRPAAPLPHPLATRLIAIALAAASPMAPAMPPVGPVPDPAPEDILGDRHATSLSSRCASDAPSRAARRPRFGDIDSDQAPVDVMEKLATEDGTLAVMPVRRKTIETSFRHLIPT